MDHSILIHSRYSHFLVTIEETVNNDFEVSEQVPLHQIWSHQSIFEDQVEKLHNLDGQWKLIAEDEGLCYDMARNAGVYRLHDTLVIVGEFDNGSGTPGFYHWMFRKVAK